MFETWLQPMQRFTEQSGDVDIPDEIRNALSQAVEVILRAAAIQAAEGDDDESGGSELTSTPPREPESTPEVDQTDAADQEAPTSEEICAAAHSIRELTDEAKAGSCENRKLLVLSWGLAPALGKIWSTGGSEQQEMIVLLVMRLSVNSVRATSQLERHLSPRIRANYVNLSLERVVSENILVIALAFNFFKLRSFRKAFMADGIVQVVLDLYKHHEAWVHSADFSKGMGTNDSNLVDKIVTNFAAQMAVQHEFRGVCRKKRNQWFKQLLFQRISEEPHRSTPDIALGLLALHDETCPVSSETIASLSILLDLTNPGGERTNILQYVVEALQRYLDKKEAWRGTQGTARYYNFADLAPALVSVLRDVSFHEKLIAFGIIPLLVRALQGSVVSESIHLEEVLQCFANLSTSTTGVKAILSTEHGDTVAKEIRKITQTRLKKGGLDRVENRCGAIRKLADAIIFNLKTKSEPLTSTETAAASSGPATSAGVVTGKHVMLSYCWCVHRPDETPYAWI